MAKDIRWAILIRRLERLEWKKELLAYKISETKKEIRKLEKEM
mgnify:CR=1 FL=1